MKSFQLICLLLFLIAFSIDSLSQERTLRPGKTYSGKFLKNENHTYTISLKKGEYAKCVVMQNGVDAAIDLADPAGKKIKTFDSPNGKNGPEDIFFVASANGNYQLHVHPSSEETSGDYEINNITILSAKAYQQKLVEEKKDSVYITNWINKNADTIVDRKSVV